MCEVGCKAGGLYCVAVGMDGKTGGLHSTIILHHHCTDTALPCCKPVQEER